MSKLENYQQNKTNGERADRTDNLWKAAEIASLLVPGAPAALKAIRDLSKQQPDTASKVLPELSIDLSDDPNGKKNGGDLNAPQTSPEDSVRQQESPTSAPTEPEAPKEGEGGGDGGTAGKSSEKSLPQQEQELPY